MLSGENKKQNRIYNTHLHKFKCGYDKSKT